MSDKLVTVATFPTLQEASVVRGQLEAEGIRTFITDGATVVMAWHLGLALGGVKLQVRNDDKERAHAILESLEPLPISDEDRRSSDADDTRASDQTSDEATSDSDSNEGDDSPNDETVSRALDAALIGVLVLPLQLYSLCLLARVWPRRSKLSPRSQKEFLTVAIIDLEAILVFNFLFSAWIRSLNHV